MVKFVLACRQNEGFAVEMREATGLVRPVRQPQHAECADPPLDHEADDIDGALGHTKSGRVLATGGDIEVYENVAAR